MPDISQVVFYLQEPSAASAVTILDVQKSDVVLDLCAAPGGKSTQIASRLEDRVSCRPMKLIKKEHRFSFPI